MIALGPGPGGKPADPRATTAGKRGMPLNAAICEDDEAQVKQIAEYLRLLPDECQIEQIIAFSAGETLLREVEEGTTFGVYLLDIDLPGINGLELARRIRSRQPSACIAFVTAYPQYTIHAFALSGNQYFLKPVNKQQFVAAMTRMLRRVAPYRVIWVNENKRPLEFLIADIVYVECYHNTMTIVTRNRNKTQFRPENIRRERLHMERLGFLKSHQGFYVNPAKIESIREHDVYCTNDIRVPISVRCRKPLMDAFTEYLENL